MFSKTFALFAVALPLVSGLSVNIPQDPRTSTECTIEWVHDQGDPAIFSIELMNEEFNDAYAIANTVDSTLESLTLVLPAVPVRDGYTIQLVNTGNISDVFAESGNFAVGPAPSGSFTRSSSVVSSTRSSSATGSGSASITRSVSSASISSTPSNSVTATGLSTGTTRPSADSSSTPTPFNAASPLRLSMASNAAPFAAMLLSAVAGAAFLVL